jgi:dCTP deaminase
VILSDREILMAHERGVIRISPLPKWGSKAWTSTSLDLTLDSEIRPWVDIDEAGQTSVIDPLDAKFNTNKLIDNLTETESCDEGFTVGPKGFVLGWTVEKIKFPHTSRIAARVEGKSSLARIGLGIHITAPTIHAGFGVNEADSAYPGSPIRLEIWNAGPLRIKLTRGMSICQLIFEEVHGTPEAAYSGVFAVQGPK